MFFNSVEKIKHQLIIIYVIFFVLPVGFFTSTLPIAVQQPTPPHQPPEPSAVTEGFEIYLPVISRLVDTDLSVSSLEITQGIQTFANSVPLVAGRPTVVRIYPHTNTIDPITGVSISISAMRNGQSLPGSPLALGPANVVVNPSRADISSSFNARLPADWLSGNVSLQITIDPSNTIEEKDETNNIYSTTLLFNSVPDLNVKVIPINHYVDVQYTGPSSYGYIGSMLLKTYPVKAVNIYPHVNYNFDGSLVDMYGWNTLLDRIIDLYYAENAPSNQVYYGLIPVETSTGHTWLGYGSGIQGNGEFGGPGAIGLASSSRYNINGGVLAAHEIGHTLLRLHSPCGVRNGIDPHYPYSGGAIGQFGLDVTDLTQFRLYADTIRDLMSYCQPAWVSDYTYQGMYNYLIQYGYRVAELPKDASDGLLIRVSTGDNGSYTLEPIYALQGNLKQGSKDSELRVEFLDESGSTIGQSILPDLNPSDPATTKRVITTLVEQPGFPFAAIRIVKNGVSQAERSVRPNPDNPISTLGVDNTLEVVKLDNGNLLRWGSPSIPAIVRYTTDQGSTWTALAVDWLGGEYYFDSGALPHGLIQFEIKLSDSIGDPLSTIWENQHP
jgi:hypothetical protein